MIVKEYYGLTGRLTAGIDDSTTIIYVSPSLSGAIAASGFIPTVNTSYFAIRSGGRSEVVRVIGVVGDALEVIRHQSGTAADAFPLGAVVEYIVTADGIIQMIATTPNNVTIAGQGLLSVTEGSPNQFTLNVPIPMFTGENGIDVLGTYPNIRFAYTPAEGNCCGGGTTEGGIGDGITDIVGEGLVTAFINGSQATVRVTAPTFNSGSNILVTGAWPSYTISATAGSGTVASVGVGAGLTLTGSPSVNPVLSITSTGVAAGTYGGVGINARGQITNVPAGFNPVSVIAAGSNVTVSRVSDTATISVADADVGVKGVVELADETDPFNPSDNTSAATPAVVALGLATIVGVTSFSAVSYSAESFATYTTPVGGSSVALSLLAGEKALVCMNIIVLDTVTPTTPVAYGAGVFNSTAIVQAGKIMTQSSQSMNFILNGPFADTLNIVTTALPGGSAVSSYSLSVLKL